MLGSIRSVLTKSLVVVAVLAFTGCGGDDGGGDDETSETTADPNGVEVDETAEAEQAVVDAYQAHWNALIAAGDPPDPDAAGLAEHATGEALTRMRSFLEGLGAEGVVVRGTYEFDARAAEVEEDRAVVEDCGLDQMEGVSAATGEVVETFDDERDGIIAEIVKEDGTWKVERLRYDEEVCP